MESKEDLEIQTIFDNIQPQRSRITGLLVDLRKHKSNLHKIHTELLSLNHTQLFVFGLDSLQFQQQTIDIECENMERIYRVQSNRMYGDFYKLHGHVENFIKENPATRYILEKLENGQVYPPYRDIEIYQEFEFRYIALLFHDIVTLLHSLEEYQDSLTGQLTGYKKKKERGLNIDNFIFAFQNCRDDLVRKISMFKKYLKYFTELHLGYLDRFIERLTMSHSQITQHIQLQKKHLGGDTDSDDEDCYVDRNGTDKINVKKETDGDVEKSTDAIVIDIVSSKGGQETDDIATLTQLPGSTEE